jgi:hypothetical protein
MKWRLALVLTFALFWCTNVFAKITVCESLVISAVEKRAQKHLAPASELSLQEYAAALAPAALLKQLAQAKLWIDLGGPTATATSEAQILFPSLKTLNADLKIESYSRRQFQGANLITDIGHAMARTVHPDLVLARVNEWLAQKGVAYLTVDRQSSVRFGASSMPLLEWLSERSRAACRPLNENTIECHKSSQIDLRTLRLISFKDGRREFSEVDPEDVEPNVVFEVHDAHGEKAGIFDAHLSADGEIMSELFFLMHIKGQGYSREIAREISIRYPKVHELRALFTKDNREKYDEKVKTLKPEEAIKETAFYRTFKPYGFLDVEFTKTMFNEIKVILRKGPDRVVFHGEIQL